MNIIINEWKTHTHTTSNSKLWKINKMNKMKTMTKKQQQQQCEWFEFVNWIETFELIQTIFCQTNQFFVFILSFKLIPMRDFDTEAHQKKTESYLNTTFIWVRVFMITRFLLFCMKRGDQCCRNERRWSIQLFKTHYFTEHRIW